MRNGRPLAVSYVTPDASQYRAEFADYVRREVEKQHWDLIPNKDRLIYVDAVFYFDKKRQDCNNYFKVMLDAITDTKLIWLDDNVVCERVQRIYYDVENPRVELTISPAPFVGIFDSKSQFDEFRANCVGCTRNSRRCSVVKNAKEGRIQATITNGHCTQYKQRKSNNKTASARIDKRS